MLCTIFSIEGQGHMGGSSFYLVCSMASSLLLGGEMGQICWHLAAKACRSY